MSIFIEKPTFINNILTDKDNLRILDLLFERPFNIGNEANLSKTHSAILEGYQHAGFTHVTADLKCQNQLNINDPLNVYVEIITNKVFKTLNLNYRYIERAHWNYYLKGQQGVGHIDRETSDYISILYNMHTTDGGTEILGKFYQDKGSEAKVFMSNWDHKGVSTKNDKARTSLNIVVRI